MSGGLRAGFWLALAGINFTGIIGAFYAHDPVWFFVCLLGVPCALHLACQEWPS